MTGPGGFDASVPDAARVLGYLLGGKDNFAADRELAARLELADPGARRRAADNRAFILAAVKRAAKDGVTQFIELDAGLPVRPSVHDAAREINPDARVAYVDRHPVALAHSRALLAGEGLAASGADPADPAAVFADPGVLSVIDPGKPAAVLLGVTLHFLDAGTARQVCAGYVSRAAPGSWLVASASWFEDTELLQQVRDVFTPAQIHPHDPATFRTFFAGTRIMQPGLTSAPRWAAGVEAGPPYRQAAYVLAAAGIKP